MVHLIACRIETEERMENLRLVVKHLKDVGDKIFVGEFDKERKIFLDDVMYMFEKDDKELFHRTKHFNTMLSKVENKIIGLTDCDVLIAKEQLKEAQRMIEEDNYDVVYPYQDNGFIMTEPLFRERYKEEGNFDFVKRHGWSHSELMKPSRGSTSTGGCCILKRSSWIEAGGENENMIGWAADDWERRDRMKILGYKQGRVQGWLLHLYHPRGSNSCDKCPTYNETMDIWRMVSKMTETELRRYIEKWEWKSRL